MQKQTTKDSKKEISDLVSLNNLRFPFGLKTEYKGKTVNAIYIGTLKEQGRRYTYRTENTASIIFTFGEENTIHRADFRLETAILDLNQEAITTEKGLFLRQRINSTALEKDPEITDLEAIKRTYNHLIKKHKQEPRNLKKDLLSKEEAIVIFSSVKGSPAISVYLNKEHYFPDEYERLKVARFIWPYIPKPFHRGIQKRDIPPKKLVVSNKLKTRDGLIFYIAWAEDQFKETGKYITANLGRPLIDGKQSHYFKYERILKRMKII